MKNIASLLLLSLLFSACHRPVMRATLEEVQPQERDLLTYSVLNKIETINDECISAAIEHKMTESGFFKTPFEADLKIYYRYAFADELSKKEKKIQVLVIDNKTNACIWKGETMNLPKKLNNDKVIAYTHLLMQRFEWENKNNDFFVRN